MSDSGHLVESGTGPSNLRRRTEEWFIAQGVPHFIAGYNATDDIFTRAALLLAVVFLVELLNGIQLEFTWLTNVAAGLAGLLVGVATFIVVNVLRDRRPFQQPDTIGPVELAVFVLVPPIIPLVFGQPRQAILTLAFNVALLAVVYVVTSYALLPITFWAVRQSMTQLRNITNLMVRSLPLLLLFTMFMFMNAEVWKVTDEMPDSFLVIALVILLVVGSAFVIMRIPGELIAVESFDSWRQVDELCAGSPQGEQPTFEGESTSSDGSATELVDPPTPSPLSRRARLNLTFVLFFSQAVQILLVTGVIFAFYVVFGTFTVLDPTIEQWTGNVELDTVLTFELYATTVHVTTELLKTSLFIAAIAGLQFTVAAVTDEKYRVEFYQRITGRIRSTLAVRALYLARLDQHRGAVAPTESSQT